MSGRRDIPLTQLVATILKVGVAYVGRLNSDGDVENLCRDVLRELQIDEASIEEAIRFVKHRPELF